MKNKPLFTFFFGFVLIFVLLFLGFFFYNEYYMLTNPYFTFLENIGYYETLYSPECATHCFWVNFPHYLPSILFTFLPIGILVFFYIQFATNKPMLKKWLVHLFIRQTEGEPHESYTENHKQSRFVHGMMVAFFAIILLFIVLPILIFVFVPK